MNRARTASSGTDQKWSVPFYMKISISDWEFLHNYEKQRKKSLTVSHRLGILVNVVATDNDQLIKNCC